SSSMRILSWRGPSGSSPFCFRMARTVLLLRWRRRVISRRLIPSWWSRYTARRLSTTIMQSPHTVEKTVLAVQDPGRQQMGLRAKGERLQLGVQTFAHHPLHVLLLQLQVAQQD